MIKLSERQNKLLFDRCMEFDNLACLVPECIEHFKAYMPSRPDEVLKKQFNCETLIRMNNNENISGPSPAALVKLMNVVHQDYFCYPNGDSYFLREALAQFHNLSLDNFIVGDGVTEVISDVMSAFCEQGDNIITADKTFAVYEWIAELSGVECRLVPLVNYGFDAEGLLQQINEKTKMIFVCNPNNPTGSYWNEEKLRDFLNKVDSRAIVVVDEAYCEFAEEPDFPNAISLLDEYPNLVVFRTFSKMYALAGLRVGYLAASKKVCDIIRKTAVCYSVNRVAQHAAVGALEDSDFQISRTQKWVATSKLFLLPELSRRNTQFISGIGNFVMIKVPINDIKFYDAMMRKGVMVRTMTGFRFPGYIRVSYRNLDDMKTFLTAFDQTIDAIKS